MGDPRWLALRAEAMTGFVRDVRTLLDEAGQKRGRRLGLAARLARRDIRGAAPSFRFLALCLTLGVAAITAVGVFAASVEEGVRRDGRALLGGDIEFRLVQRAASSEELSALERFGAVSQVASLRTMAQPGTAPSPSRRSPRVSASRSWCAMRAPRSSATTWRP